MKKAKRNVGPTSWEKKVNTPVGRIRFKVACSFGRIAGRFNGGKARYRGLEKTRTRHLPEAIGYNLYRSPGIIASNSI